MKSKVALLCLGLAGTAFSMDEYLPVQQGKLEVDLGYSFVKYTGGFDGDGERQSWEDVGFPSDYSPVLHNLGVQLKYGVAAGLDVELALIAVTSNDDADYSGFYRPEIGVKYANPAMKGAGVYANVALPFSGGDVDIPGTGTSLELGGVYQNRFGDFRMTGRAGYMLNLESDDVKNGNTLLLYLKPEAMWTEYIGTYLGVQFMQAGETEINGTGFDDAGHHLAVVPGLNVQLTEKLAYEVNVPISVLGKNSDAAWGVTAQLYVTLP
jgi:hypothetical protein